MAVLADPVEPASAAKGHFLLVMANADKGLRRFRLCTGEGSVRGRVDVYKRAGCRVWYGNIHTSLKPKYMNAPCLVVFPGRCTHGCLLNAVSAAPLPKTPFDCLHAHAHVTLPHAEQQKANAAHTRATLEASRSGRPAPRGAPQSFQLPDVEKPLELQLPAHALAVSPAGDRMALACADGALCVYSLPDMQPQGRWLLHQLPAGGASAVDIAGDLLICGGTDVCVHMVELGPVNASTAIKGRSVGGPGVMSVGPGRAASGVGPSMLSSSSSRVMAAGSTLPPCAVRPAGMERMASGSLVPLGRVAEGAGAVTVPMLTQAGQVVTWQELRWDMQIVYLCTGIM